MIIKRLLNALAAALGAIIAQGCSPETAQTPPETSGARGAVYTADERGNSISVIDLATGEVATTPVSISPHNVQASENGESIFAVGSLAPAGAGAAEGGHGHSTGVPGRLLGFDTAAVPRGPVLDMEVGEGPAHVIVDRRGARAFVTNGGDNSVSVVDLSRRETVKSISVGASPHGLRMSPDGGTIYVANTGDGTVSVINVEALAETARIAVGRAPVQVAFTPDGRYCYVSLRDENSVAVVETASRRVVTKIPVGSNPIQLHALPNGREVYVANEGTREAPGNTVSVVDTATQRVISEIVTGAGPHGVVVNRSGDRVLVTNSFADTVSEIDTADRRVVRTYRVGAGPGGVTMGAGPT